MCDCEDKTKRIGLNYCPKIIITKPRQECNEYTFYRFEPKKECKEYTIYTPNGPETRRICYTTYETIPEKRKTYYTVYDTYEKCLRCGRERKL